MYSRKHYYGLYEEARKQAAGIDIATKAKYCGFIAGNGSVRIESLAREYDMKLPDCEIVNVATGREMPLIMRVVTLHHLINAEEVSLRGELTALRKFPDLESYGPTIKWRSEDVLSKAFGDAPAKFGDTAVKHGGTLLDIGDSAARIYPLPMLPMTIVVNGGDEDFPAETTIMYDSTAIKFLHPEDLVVLAEVVSHKLAGHYVMSLEGK